MTPAHVGATLNCDGNRWPEWLTYGISLVNMSQKTIRNGEYITMAKTQHDGGVTYIEEAPAISEDAEVREAQPTEVADGDVTVLTGAVYVRAEDGGYYKGDQPKICYRLPGGRRGAAAFNRSTYAAAFWDGNDCGEGNSFGLHAGYDADPAPIAISRFYLYG